MRRQKRIFVRTDNEFKTFLDTAAQATGTTVSDLVRRGAAREAERRLLERTDDAGGDGGEE